MSYIEVNTLYLRNLAARTREAEHVLRQFSNLAGGALHSSPKVRDAYTDLSWRWDMRRNELADALSAVADGFDTAASGFEETDEQLARTLTGE